MSLSTAWPPPSIRGASRRPAAPRVLRFDLKGRLSPRYLVFCFRRELMLSHFVTGCKADTF